MLKRFTEHPCKFFSFMLDLEVLVYVLVRRNVSYRTMIFFFWDNNVGREMVPSRRLVTITCWRKKMKMVRELDYMPRKAALMTGESRHTYMRFDHCPHVSRCNGNLGLTGIILIHRRAFNGKKRKWSIWSDEWIASKRISTIEYENKAYCGCLYIY